MTTAKSDDEQKVKTADSKYSSMTEAERIQRLEEYVANIDVEEFASLTCGGDIHFTD